MNMLKDLIKGLTPERFKAKYREYIKPYKRKKEESCNDLDFTDYLYENVMNQYNKYLY